MRRRLFMFCILIVPLRLNENEDEGWRVGCMVPRQNVWSWLVEWFLKGKSGKGERGGGVHGLERVDQT